MTGPRRVPTGSGLPAGFSEGDSTPPFTGIVEAKQHFPVQPRVLWGLDFGHGGATTCVLSTRDAAGNVLVLQTFTAPADSDREALLFAFLREFIAQPEGPRHGD